MQHREIYHREVLCNYLNLCSNGEYERKWIGLEQTSTSPHTWQYLDGTVSPYDDSWWPYDEYDSDSQHCGYLVNLEYGAAHELTSAAYNCDQTLSTLSFVCENQC